MQDLVWLIPVLPLAGFVLLMVAGRRLGDPRAGWLGTLVVAGSFVASIAMWIELGGLDPDQRVVHQVLFTWIPAGAFRVDIGLLADPLSIAMCMFITGIGALIHLYSIGYMKGDPDYAKFFVYLNLFIASMLLLILGDNLLLTFLGWEGVGACSYLLISFWFSDRANASAGKKAFVTNRIGDFGFMLGTFLLWLTIGTVNYTDIPSKVEGIPAVTATAVVLLFFLAATGKSAQLPLFVWLPDAMAGPTPVSALIHAATMVTSGVFLLTRLNPLFGHAGVADDVIAWVGVATALVAALAAVAQNDIKKVLAYSTVSQLGYMFLAIGTGAFTAAIFHMITHAFFKALLFLGSGSVIHAMDHEQDMRRYGSLRRYLPITSATFIIGWLAISGVPPFAGFWSKDEILAGAWAFDDGGPVLWALGLVVALLTAFYMTRLVILTFFGGEEKWRTPLPATAGDHAGAGSDVVVDPDDADHHHHLSPDHTPKEPPWTMTAPLVVLAGLALVGGLLNLPFGDRFHVLEHWLEPMLAHGHEALPGGALAVLAVVAVLAALGGIWFAYRLYQQHRGDPAKVEQPAFAHALYIDETYAKVVAGPGEAAFQGVADFDANVVDGAVDGVGAGVQELGRGLQPLQTGMVRSYALFLAGGTVALLVFVVLRMSL
jgi:NADH-quinone oxidoreductase subunit L